MLWLVLLVAAAFGLRALVPELLDGVPQALWYWLGTLSKLAAQGFGSLFAAQSAARFERGSTIRRAWAQMAFGLGGFFVAQLVLVYYQLALHNKIPFPSWADLFFLVLGYPALLAALVSFVRAYQQSGFPMGSSDERWTLVVGVMTACVLAGYQPLRHFLAADTPALHKAINIAYPLLDFVMLVPTALLLRVAFSLRGRVQRVWLALLVGVLGLAGGDVLFGYLSMFGWARLDPVVDALFVLGYGACALGALAQREILAG
jgi:hypothetical protein